MGEVADRLEEKPIVIDPVDPSNPNQLGNMPYAGVADTNAPRQRREMHGDSGAAVFTSLARAQPVIRRLQGRSRWAHTSLTSANATSRLS